MNWFYALNGQQAGPVDDAELDRLVQAGTIDRTTLVWCNGMAQWQPYAEARPVVPALAGAVPVDAGQAQCSQCGQVLPADEVVRVDKYQVCALCKPLLLQKLREGVPLTSAFSTAPPPAGFWIRLGAAILDFLILIPFYALVAVLAYLFFPGLYDVTSINGHTMYNYRLMTAHTAPFSLAIYLCLAFYSAFCVHRFGGTPGKRICKLRVVRGSEGGPVSLGRALSRFLVKMVPRFVPFLNLVYLIADPLFIVLDPQKRALHDMICDTRVVVDTHPAILPANL